MYALWDTTLFSAPEHDLHVSVEEEALLGYEEYLRYFREVIFARETHFDGRDRLVQPAVVKSHRPLGIQSRLYFQMSPPHRKAGSACHHIRQGIRLQLGKGLTGGLPGLGILYIHVIRLQHADRDTSRVQCRHRNAIFVALSANKMLLTHRQLEDVKIIQFVWHQGAVVELVRGSRYLMFLCAFLFIQLELIQDGTVGSDKLALLEIDAIAIRRQAYTEYIMLVKDKIPFFLHSYQIVDPVSLSIFLIPSGGDIAAVLGIETYNGQ